AAEARMAVAEAGLAADPDDRAGGPAVSTAGATGPGDDAGDRGAFNEDGEGDAGSAGAAA
ncbi:MAG TPA: hypothetical protein VNE21_00830, partial [Mycobacteriales bacterium]|nr:hypothetical protein [Mycobacteriales bacterium]